MSDSALSSPRPNLSPRPDLSRRANWGEIRRGVFVAACFALLALMPLIARWVDEPFLVRQFIQIMVMGLAAMSLDLILGFGGLVSFGHAAFVGLAAYTVGILDFHAADGSLFLGLIPGSTDARVVWPAAIGVSLLAAGIIGAICTQASGMYFIMLTLAFAQMVYYVFTGLTLYGADEGMQINSRSDFPGLNITNNLNFYYLVFAALLLSYLVLHRLVRSRFGMVLRGIRQNERRLAAIGFATRRYKLAAFIIAGGFGGLAGVLLANYQTFVSPGDLSWTRSGELTSMVVLGGIGSLFGPVLGAAAYLLLQLVIGSYTTHWQAFFGPFLILVVLFARRGLFGFFTGGGRLNG
jgi:branched-chain amino acid transport system permease protein